MALKNTRTRRADGVRFGGPKHTKKTATHTQKKKRGGCNAEKNNRRKERDTHTHTKKRQGSVRPSAERPKIKRKERNNGGRGENNHRNRHPGTLTRCSLFYYYYFSLAVSLLAKKKRNAKKQRHICCDVGLLTFTDKTNCIPISPNSNEIQWIQ